MATRVKTSWQREREAAAVKEARTEIEILTVFRDRLRKEFPNDRAKRVRIIDAVKALVK